MRTLKLALNNHLCVVDYEDYAKYAFYPLTVRVDPRDGYTSLKFMQGSHSLSNKVFARVVMNCPESLEVDHKDGDPLNNAKDNLRLVTKEQQNHNTSGSGYKELPKGIYRTPSGNYLAVLYTKGRRIRLGTFPVLDVAVKAYQEACNKFQGEYAFHNRPNLELTK